MEDDNMPETVYLSASYAAMPSPGPTRSRNALHHYSQKLQGREAARYIAVSEEQAAHRARVEHERECKQDRRWLHAQVQRGGISVQTNRELLHFFKRGTPNMWTIDDGFYNKRVPDLGMESVRVWMRLQDERAVWAKENGNGFEDDFAPEKDWWKKTEVPKKGKRKRGEKRRHEEENEETKDLNEQDAKRSRLEKGREDRGYITPIPLSMEEFKAMFG